MGDLDEGISRMQWKDMRLIVLTLVVNVPYVDPREGAIKLMYRQARWGVGVGRECLAYAATSLLMPGKSTVPEC